MITRGQAVCVSPIVDRDMSISFLIGASYFRYQGPLENPCQHTKPRLSLDQRAQRPRNVTVASAWQISHSKSTDDDRPAHALPPDCELSAVASPAFFPLSLIFSILPLDHFVATEIAAIMVHASAVVSTAAAAALLLAALPFGAQAQAMYSKNSPVVQVTGRTYDKLIAQSNYTSVSAARV